MSTWNDGLKKHGDGRRNSCIRLSDNISLLELGVFSVGLDGYY